MISKFDIMNFIESDFFAILVAFSAIIGMLLNVKKLINLIFKFFMYIKTLSYKLSNTLTKKFLVLKKVTNFKFNFTDIRSNISKTITIRKRKIELNRTYKEINEIVSKSTLNRKKKNCEFLVELLNDDIEILKDIKENRITISIDRTNVDHYLISNSAKDSLSEKIVYNRQNELKNKDIEFHKMLNGVDKTTKKKIRISTLDDPPLRWVSGGILSIVKYQNRYWIPFFFRDKDPYGWNICLGSSQSIKNKKTPFDYELTDPRKLMYREFQEELLILQNPPKEGQTNYIRTFQLQDSNADYIKEHLILRKKYDNLNLSYDGKKIYTDIINTNMILKVKKNSNIETIPNVLVCFNLLELGVEIVQVIKFDLDDNNYILDGELIEDIELARMPVALISCEYLEKIFKGCIEKYSYKPGTQSPIDTGKIIPPKEMILFQFDIEQRLKIVNGKKKYIRLNEYNRYKNSFKSYFENSSLNIKNTNIGIFTPATAKILNLFFSQVESSSYKLGNMNKSQRI